MNMPANCQHSDVFWNMHVKALLQLIFFYYSFSTTLSEYFYFMNFRKAGLKAQKITYIYIYSIDILYDYYISSSSSI